MNENEIARSIVDKVYSIHKNIGPGLLESVYETILANELINLGFDVHTQKAIPIEYNNHIFDQGFRADLMVNNSVIVELKSIEKIAQVHKKQLLTYLRLSNKKLGLLINFGENLIKDGIHRVVNGL